MNIYCTINSESNQIYFFDEYRKKTIIYIKDKQILTPELLSWLIERQNSSLIFSNISQLNQFLSLYSENLPFNCKLKTFNLFFRLKKFIFSNYLVKKFKLDESIETESFINYLICEKSIFRL